MMHSIFNSSFLKTYLQCSGIVDTSSIFYLFFLNSHHTHSVESASSHPHSCPFPQLMMGCRNFSCINTYRQKIDKIYNRFSLCWRYVRLCIIRNEGV